METAVIASIRAKLRAVRRRMMVNVFLRSAARATLFFYGLLVVLRSVAWWGGQTRPDPASLPYMLSWPFILGAFSGLLIILLRRPTFEMAAARADAFGESRDRLVSALAFSHKTAPSEMERLAIAEAGDWAARQDLRAAAPIRFPREFAWLAVPLAMLALLWWHESDRAKQKDAAISAAQDQVRGTTSSLEAIAKQLEQRAAANGDETLRRVADRLRQSAAKVRAEAERGGESQRAALRELSELEQLVRQLRQPAGVTAEELKAIAQTLAQAEETKEAAQAIEENRYAEAAQKLDEAAQHPNAEKIEAELRNAVEHLARRKEQLSKQLEQLQQGAQEAGEPRQQMLKEVAEMMRELAQQPSAKPGDAEGKDGEQKAAQAQKQKAQEGKQMTDEDLQKLLGALQQMKDQQQQQDQPPEPGAGDSEGEESGEGSGPVTMLSFQSSPDAQPIGEVGVPTGQPGSERDEGTTKDPFAGSAGETPEAARQEQLKGQLGEGETLSALMPAAAAGNAQAVRRYKDLTEAAAASAEDAVLQESLPLGSRFLIKRYFEAIQPRE